MYAKTIIRNLVIIGVIFAITYALAVGIDQGNTLSIFLSLGGLAALFVCIYLASRLVQTAEEEEYQES
jgi:hypothetical protein